MFLHIYLTYLLLSPAILYQSVIEDEVGWVRFVKHGSFVQTAD